MAMEGEEVATKGDLAKLEGKLVECIDDVEARLTHRMNSLESSFNANMDEKLEAMQTRLLTAFERYAVPIEWPCTQT